jgi:hypothetical protein
MKNNLSPFEGILYGCLLGGLVWLILWVAVEYAIPTEMQQRTESAREAVALALEVTE